MLLSNYAVIVLERRTSTGLCGIQIFYLGRAAAPGQGASSWPDSSASAFQWLDTLGLQHKNDPGDDLDSQADVVRPLKRPVERKPYYAGGSDDQIRDTQHLVCFWCVEDQW